MNLIFELGILFLICMAGEGIAVLLPITIPASVISLILLLILLLSGVLKERQIRQSAVFLTENMGILFIPAAVGTLEYLDVLKAQAIPFLLITVVSTPIVYFITAWSVQLLMKLFNRKKVQHHV